MGRHGGGVSRRVRGETHPPYPPRVSNPSPNTTTTNARVLDPRVCRHVKMLGWAVRARRRECAGRRASGWCSLCALVGVSFRKLTEPTPTPVFLRKDKRVPCAQLLTPIPIAPGWLVVMWGAERRRWWAEKTQAAQEVVLVRAAARTCVRPRVCRRMVARGAAGPPKKRRLSAPQPSQERSAPRLQHFPQTPCDSVVEAAQKRDITESRGISSRNESKPRAMWWGKARIRDAAEIFLKLVQLFY